MSSLHSDQQLPRRDLYDMLVELRRALRISGFANVKQATIDCEAIGASINGFDPIIFGCFDSRVAVDHGALAMHTAIEDESLTSYAFVGPLAWRKAKVVS